MRLLRWNLAAVAVTFVVLAGGCGTSVALRDYKNIPILSPPGKPLTLAELEYSIRRAGAAAGWDMQPVSPGHVTGTFEIRSHVSVVDVRFTTENFSITYRDSTNLDYNDGRSDLGRAFSPYKGARIHVNYNFWVKRLKAALAGMRIEKAPQ